MKKFLAFALAAVLSLSCLFGCSKYDEDTVLVINGDEVSWDEYMYWIAASEEELSGIYSNYLGTTTIDWSGAYAFDSSTTNAEWCVKQALIKIKQIHVIEQQAKKQNITLSDEETENIDSTILSYAQNYCGENATEDDYNEYLQTNYNTTVEYQKYVLRMSLYYQDLFIDEFGDGGTNFSDTDKINAFADSNGYVSANHILLLTVDMSTGESLSDSAIAEKKTKAEELAAELQQITDQEELLARFSELKTEFCEDTGKVAYPNGYCFTYNSMVSAFDTATRALELYQVSDPVLSDYGYHIIIRLPNDPDATVTGSSSSSTLRGLAAVDAFSTEVDGWTSAAEVSYVGNFEKYDFTQLFGADGFTYTTYDARPGTSK